MLGLTLSVGLMWMAAAPAQAQTVNECQAKINDLKTATRTATFIGRNAEMDRAGLVDKLVSANTKLERGKLADARVNLERFRTKVVALDQQGKIAHEDALRLTAGADEAIGCVQGRIEQQATPAA